MTEPAPAPAPAPAPTPAPGPWYGDKIDEVTRGFWQNKGIDVADPIAVASKLTEMYRKAESHIGAPPEELIRIPKPNAPETDIRAYWGRIGVPAEPKDYDLSAVKAPDGQAIETAFADMFRAAAHAARVPKDRAGDMFAALVKQRADTEAAALALKTSIVNEEKTLLDKNWGANKNYNLAMAERALGDLARAAGVPADKAKAAWDALSTVGGIGASYVMEMLRTIGARMSEGTPFITSGDQGKGGGSAMSQAQAKARIEELKMDKAFYKRLVTDKEVAARREWDDLHKIAFRAA